jgi:ATP-dependent DNA helicase RecG
VVERTGATKNGHWVINGDAAITTNITTNDTTTEMQKRITAIMSANPNVTAKALAAELGIAGRNVKNHIKALEDAGMVERIGATKNGHWAVK